MYVAGLRLRRDERHMQTLGCPSFGVFASPVVASSGGDVGVSDNPLDDADVDASVKHVRYARTTKVVGRECLHPCFDGARLQNRVDSLVGHSS